MGGPTFRIVLERTVSSVGCLLHAQHDKHNSSTLLIQIRRTYYLINDMRWYIIPRDVVRQRGPVARSRIKYQISCQGHNGMRFNFGFDISPKTENQDPPPVQGVLISAKTISPNHRAPLGPNRPTTSRSFLCCCLSICSHSV